MRLTKLQLKNFRSCEDTIVEFSEDLTILVGENGSGKSNIIDAIRLSTPSAIDHGSLWFNADRDKTYGKPKDIVIEIDRHYSDLTEQEKAVYLAQLVDDNDSLIYNTNFNPTPGLPTRSQIMRSVGENKIADSEAENRERIAHVYLPPLRDAIREIGSGDGSRLAEVLRVLADNDTEAFEEAANHLIIQVAALDLPKNAKSAVQQQLKKLTHPSRKHEVHVGGRQQELKRLSALLEVMLSEKGIDAANIGAAGLGFANLLYISMIVLHLEKAREYDLTLLLVEEPEAHLHPQLQSILLAYLRDRAKESQEKPGGTLEPSGRVQVIVTTHSPNLASSISTTNMVAVSRQPIATQENWSTKTRALNGSKLNKLEQRKIDRYLNVTRGSLVFARQVILVEGIADAVLLPSVARHIVLKEDEANIRQMDSTSIIAIDGVDFEPYLKLLLNGDFALAEKVVVVTDGDKKGDEHPGLDRKTKYEEQFAQAIEDKILTICVGEYTLEADLFGEEENNVLLKRAWLEIHKRSGDKWDAIVARTNGDSTKRAEWFREAMRDTADKDIKLDIGKGDFSQIIADGLETRKEDENFVIPDYLQQAIKSVLLPVDDEPVEDLVLPVSELTKDD